MQRQSEMGHLGASQFLRHGPAIGGHQGLRTRLRHGKGDVHGAPLNSATARLQRREDLKNRRFIPFLGFLSGVKLLLSSHLMNPATPPPE